MTMRRVSCRQLSSMSLKNNHMSLLFSPSGLERLDALVQPGMLCAFDFDGTLAPIVAQPDNARLPADVLMCLVELAKYAPVAIITGRSIADIGPRLGFKPTYLIGNHGIEGVPGWEERLNEHAVLCRRWLVQLADALRDTAVYDPAIEIEEKNYSLSLHYRLAKDPAQSARQMEALFATLTPAPHIIAGKCVFNLLPPNAANKGSAFNELMQLCGAPSAIYVGDDVTDEDVFRLHRKDVLSVRVENAPDTAADFYLQELGDMSRLFEELIVRLKRCQADVQRRPATMRGM